MKVATLLTLIGLAMAAPSAEEANRPIDGLTQIADQLVEPHAPIVDVNAVALADPIPGFTGPTTIGAAVIQAPTGTTTYLGKCVMI
jgi:hypothetical protein